MRRRLLALTVVPALLLLGACGDDDDAGTSPTPSVSASASASDSASDTASASTTPSADPSCTQSADVPDHDGSPFVTVTGDFGVRPTVEISTGTPSDKLVTETLVEGDGRTVEKGDLLVADYIGYIWDSCVVFDASYDRGQPSGFPIGISAVIVGWDQALVGQKVGARVVMSVPPSLGYVNGNDAAGISKDDTLVFVVDLVGTYNQSDIPVGTPANPDLTGKPQVSGDLGKEPTITVPAGTEPPTEQAVTVLAEGKGDPVEGGGTVVMAYKAVAWDGSDAGSTWTSTEAAPAVPQAYPVGTAQASPFDALVGIPIGSRVLLVIPAPEGGEPATQSYAVVIDIIDEAFSAAAGD